MVASQSSHPKVPAESTIPSRNERNSRSTNRGTGRSRCCCLSPEAVLVEDYPDFAKGPRVLVLQKDQRGNSLHVELIEYDSGGSPYLSLEDAYRLDEVREALIRGDIRGASRLARVYSLTPVAI
jgi:hypothetical protein